MYMYMYRYMYMYIYIYIYIYIYFHAPASRQNRHQSLCKAFSMLGRKRRDAKVLSVLGRQVV